MTSVSSLKDLSRIGVLLIGVALIIIASIALHFYITYLSKTFENSYMTRPFISYCSPSRVIIIEARQDLMNVKVLDNSSNTICLFDKIPKNSKEICNVQGYGVYVIQYGEFKDVVECIRSVVVESRPVD
ncbi:MAG: hypothetical protein QXF28_03355 [Nitrososphaerota archaeon]